MAATCALMAAATVVADPAAVALVACHGGVIMIIMMALVLTIVRLLVAWIRAALFPRMLARFMDLATFLIGAIELRLIIAALLVAVLLVIAAVIPDAGLLTAVA